ncbi:MAG TPA: hypothetical protein VNZ52_05950 [Candidatus Thermoplasmatota archaeon]|nr:hypothetical protein [Candidatus Thermoplasmatota archaeon]
MVYSPANHSATGLTYALLILGVLLSFIFILLTVKYGWNNTVEMARNAGRLLLHAAKLSWEILLARLASLVPG